MQTSRPALGAAEWFVAHHLSRTMSCHNSRVLGELFSYNHHLVSLEICCSSTELQIILVLQRWSAPVMDANSKPAKQITRQNAELCFTHGRNARKQRDR